MKSQLRKFHFTLVEVLIAMGICIVGVVSVMGLFPVGANAARDASMAFYADQAAEQMLNFTRYAVLNAKDSSDNFSPAIFNVMTGGWNIEDTSSYTANSKPDQSAEPNDWDSAGLLEDDSSVQEYLIGGMITDNMITMLTNNGTVIKKHSWNLYRIGFVTNNGGEDLEDFACVVRLWATPVHIDEVDSSSIKLPRIATFHAEVSWPADMSYGRRQKAEYTLDVFVPEG